MDTLARYRDVRTPLIDPDDVRACAAELDRIADDVMRERLGRPR